MYFLKRSSPGIRLFPRFYGKLKHEFDINFLFNFSPREYIENTSRSRPVPGSPLVFHPHRRHTCFSSLFPIPRNLPAKYDLSLRESAYLDLAILIIRLPPRSFPPRRPRFPLFFRARSFLSPFQHHAASTLRLT